MLNGEFWFEPKPHEQAQALMLVFFYLKKVQVNDTQSSPICILLNYEVSQIYTLLHLLY